jgi:polyphenol oxidase
MLFEKRNGLFIGRFHGLYDRPDLVHGFSMRKGGVSSPPYDTLNLGLNTEDGTGATEENHRRFWNAMFLDSSCSAIPRQVHGDRILAVNDPGIYPDTDALITNRSDLFLVVQTADCLPVFIVDPVKRAIGLVHAGRRGSARQIASKTVRAMAGEFGSAPENLEAYLGPSIGPCCYTVGKEVSDEFEPHYIRDGKLDLWHVNSDQLIDAGLHPARIESSRLCTACHHEWFFSHRVSGGKTGRMMGVLALAG